MSHIERLLKKKQDHEIRIKQKQEEKHRSELVGCTVHPIILTNVSNRHFYHPLMGLPVNSATHVQYNPGELARDILEDEPHHQIEQ